jgi:membrane dipeptidase
MKKLWSAALAAFALLPALVAETDAELAARAAALHARIFTIDTHLDTPTLSLRRPGWDITQRHDVPTDDSQVDFPRMREGGLKAAVFVVFVDQGKRTPEAFAAIRDNSIRSFLRVHALAERYPEQCGVALTADDGPRLQAAGKRALYLSIENGYAIGKDLTLLKTYHDLGARFFGFVHNGNNDLGDSSQPEKGPEWNGLSPLGEQTVMECNRLGLVIDGSHSSDATVRRIIALSKTPIILTHSACKALRDHRRNVSDDLLREVAASGGVIQMNTVANFVAPEVLNPEFNAAKTKFEARYAGRDLSDAESAQMRLDEDKLERQFFPVKPATLDDVLKHLFHAIEIAGADHVGIGADMDGGGGVAGLEDVSTYPKITFALLKHGLSESDVEKIWGGNTLRLLRAAEDYAKAQKKA